MYYNKTLWKSTGLPEPDANVTWDFLIDAAKTFASKNNRTINDYGLMSGDEGLSILFHQLEKTNINLVEVSPDQVQLNQPAIVAIVERVKKLTESGAIYSFASRIAHGHRVSSTAEDIEQLVRSQHLAMWRADAFPFDPSDPQIGFEVGRIPLPELAQRPSLSGQNGFIMSSGTQHPEAAWQWLSFLSHQALTNYRLSRTCRGRH